MPLQLFEPRYLALAQHLADEPPETRHFGIVLIRQGHEVGDGRVRDLHPVGCEARIDAMALAEAPIGTVVHLVARGDRRFRLDAIDENAGTPFTTGEVTWLDEPAPDEAELDTVTAKVLAAHARYLDAVGATTEPVETTPRDTAYRVLERMVVDPIDRQRVLEGANAATRLRTVLALLTRETAIVQRFGALPTPPDPSGASLN